MLQNIRDNSQGVVSKVIIGLLVGVFAMFGAESIVGGFFGGNNAVTVNGEGITEQQVSTSVQNLMMQLGSEVANYDEDVLQEIALGQLVEESLLRQAAERADMAISSESLDREILRTPQFQVNGRFDDDLARRVMTSQGFTPSMYRAALAEQMLLGQLVNAYAGSSFVTEASLERIAALQGQTRDFRYVAVPLGTRSLGEAIDPEAIQAYYDNNPSEFTTDEQIVIEYVLLDKDQIFSELDINEARVREQYESERAEALGSVERRAAHILFETSSALSEEEALDLAREAKTRIDAGEDFGEVARDVSHDVISAEADGDIGYTDGSVFPDALEQALDNLDVGDVSEPVISEFGVHLVRLTEYDTRDYPEFEEVAERIERNLTQGQLDQLYFSRLEVLANLAFESFDLLPIEEELGIPVQRSARFSRRGGTDPVTSHPGVINAAYSVDVLDDELNSDVIELSESRAVVLRVAEHHPAALQPFDEVRGEIAIMLRTEQERAKTREVGERILAALESGEDVSELLAAESLTWSERSGVRRDQFDLNTDVVQTVFSMSVPSDGEPVRQGRTLNNGAYVVVELHAVHSGNVEDLDADQREALMTAMRENHSRSSFDALMTDLQQTAKIR